MANAAAPSTSRDTGHVARVSTRPARANTQPPLSAANTKSSAAQSSVVKSSALVSSATSQAVRTPGSRGAASAHA